MAICIYNKIFQQQHKAEELRYKSKIILTTAEGKNENNLHINCA